MKPVLQQYKGNSQQIMVQRVIILISNWKRMI